MYKDELSHPTAGVISQAMYMVELTSHYMSKVCDIRSDAHTHTLKFTTGMST